MVLVDSKQLEVSRLALQVVVPLARFAGDGKQLAVLLCFEHASIFVSIHTPVHRVGEVVDTTQADHIAIAIEIPIIKTK